VDTLLASGHWVVCDELAPDFISPEPTFFRTTRMHMNDKEAPAPAWFDQELARTLAATEKSKVRQIIFGIHSWCDQANTEKQGVLLAKEAHHDHWCYLNGNDYGAYRYSETHGKVKLLEVKGHTASFAVLRFEPSFLGSRIPLSLKVSGMPKAVSCDGQALVAGKRGTWTLPHAADRGMPAQIGKVGPNGVSEKFPALKLTVERQGEALVVSLTNKMRDPLRRLNGVVLLPPNCGEMRQVISTKELKPGKTWTEKVAAPSLATNAYYAVEIDFRTPDANGRLWLEK